MAEVLCAGVDRSLMNTRKLILERGGHAVTAVMSEQDLRDACARKSFEVAVIGPSVVPPEKQRILDLVRQFCPDAKILELCDPHTPRLKDADAWMEVLTEPPEQLEVRVAELAGMPKQKKKKA